MPYVAMRPLDDGIREYAAGDVIPEVESWPTFGSLVSNGWIRLTDSPGELAKILQNPSSVVVRDAVDTWNGAHGTPESGPEDEDEPGTEEEDQEESEAPVPGAGRSTRKTSTRKTTGRQRVAAGGRSR